MSGLFTRVDRLERDVAALRRLVDGRSLAQAIASADPAGDRLASIVSAAASAFAVDLHALMGPSKAANACRARRGAAYVLRALGYSLRRIGVALGGRDHSTVSQLVRGAKADLADPAFMVALKSIAAELRFPCDDAGPEAAA